MPTAPKKTTTPAVKAASTLKQPPFDPRMRSVHQPFMAGDSTFSRGFMVWDTTTAGDIGYSASDPPYVAFLFNPSTVQSAYQIQSTAATSTMIFGVPTASGAHIAPYTQLGQSMSFTIMFDRTYEVNSPNSTRPGEGLGSDVYTMGCEVDVRAMKQFTGMFSSAFTGTGGYYTNTSTTTTTQQTFTPANGVGVGPQQGLMLMIPSYVYFGSDLIGGTSQFYGYISYWDVQYTHFTATMVPIRCVVDITYTLLPLSSSAAAEYSNSAVEALASSQNFIPSAAFTGG